MFFEPIYEYGGFTLVRRPDSPNYYITHYAPGSRRMRPKSTRTADLEKAKSKLRRIAAARGRMPKRTPDEMPILEPLCDYVERTGPHDFRRYAIPAALKTWMRYLDAFGITMLDELTLDVQDEFVAWRIQDLQDQGYGGSTGTVRRELGVLKAAIRDAWKRGLLTEVPYIRSAPMPRPRQRYLTPEEAQRLLAACSQPHIRLYVLLALHTLQRPKAIVELRKEQVDLDAGHIDFHPAGGVESTKQKPVVPITATLRPALIRAVRETRSGHIIEYNGRAVSKIRSGFDTARRAAGLSDDVTPYVLRHTGATLLAAAGVSMRQISGMLGHSHTRTTEMYAKHAPGFLGHAAATLDQIFGPAAQIERQRLLPPPDIDGEPEDHN